jgi:hypothetical protein
MNDLKRVYNRHWTLAGFLALGLMLPSSAFTMDSTPNPGDHDQAAPMLSLPPIPYLETMGWMIWTPIAPVFKVDTLLVPDALHPGLLGPPVENGRTLPQVS